MLRSSFSKLPRCLNDLACEQALLFGRVKNESRENARARDRGPLAASPLARAFSRDSFFTRPNRRACSQAMDDNKLRAVYYFSLQSYARRKPCSREAKPRTVKRERLDLNWFHWKALAEKRKARAWNVSGTQGKFSIVKSLFTISLARIRTKQILREKAGYKQSRKTFLNVWNKHDLETRNIVRRDLRVCLNNRGFPSFLCRALVTMPHMERFKIVFFLRTETYI